MKRELLSLIKKYKIPVTQLNKEILVDEELLEEVAGFLSEPVTAPFAFPGFVFRWKHGLGLEVDEKKAEAVREEYGVEVRLWDPPGVPSSESIFLEPDVRYSRSTLLSSLSAFPRKLVVVSRESVLLGLIAEPGWREYSPLSVFAHLFYDLKDIFRVENQAFFPPGKSSLGVAFLSLRRPYMHAEEFLYFLRKVFETKRKRIVPHGKRPLEMDPEELLEWFETTNKR